MKAHILTIGDELLIGQIRNSNTEYIGNALSLCSINTVRSSVVGDSDKAILEEMEYSWQRADLVVITGGLGPTHDDRTRDAIARFFDSELVESEEILEDIKERFDRLNRKVTKNNRDQALLPAIAEPIHNYQGTAPGYWVEKDDKILVAMPGVPYEMEAMMKQVIIPRLDTRMKKLGNVTKRLTLLTTGMPESTLFEKIEALEEILENFEIAFLPSPLGVAIRITVSGMNEEEAGDRLIEAEQKIRTIAGRYIYGKGEDELAAVLGRLLKDRELTLAVAESCTGGSVSSQLTHFPGSSGFFERGIVAYSNAAKVELLQVNEDMLMEHGAVSIEAARQMADGIRAISGTDIGLSITGILGPTGGTAEKPVGLVIMGLADEQGCTVRKFQFGNDRAVNKMRAMQSALDLLRKYLLGIPLDA